MRPCRIGIIDFIIENAARFPAFKSGDPHSDQTHRDSHRLKDVVVATTSIGLGNDAFTIGQIIESPVSLPALSIFNV